MIKTKLVKVRLNSASQIIPNSEEPIGECKFPAFPQGAPNQPTLVTYQGVLYGVAATRWEVIGAGPLTEEAVLVLACIPVTISSLAPPQSVPGLKI